MFATKIFVSLVVIVLFASVVIETDAQKSGAAPPSFSYSEGEIAPRIPTTSTTTETPPSTTKKGGFFSGWFKKSDKKKDKEEKTTTTTTPKPTTPTTVKTTTVKVTTTTTPKPDKNAPTPKLPSIASALPTPYPTYGTTTTLKPGKGETPKPPSIASALPTPGVVKPQAPTVPTTTTTTVKPVQKKDDFPALPSVQSGPPSPTVGPKAPTPTSTIANAWLNTPTTITTPPTPPKVSFVPTQAPAAGAPTTAKKPDSTPVSSGPTTDNELISLSEQLFSKDANNPNKYVTIDFQARTWSGATDDEAPNPLLKVDEAKAYAMPTIEKMRALFNNYELDTSVNEYVSPMEKKEEIDFIDALVQTSVMRQAMTFLQQKGVVTADPKTHKELLKTIWFNIYSRGNGKTGSSGFEHVFLNEIKNKTVIGLHNWVYFNDQEKSGHLDYHGYTKKLDLGNKGTIAKVRLSFDKIHKPTNSLFIGTSPELELALYTVCFQLRADKDCYLSADGSRFLIKTFTFKYGGKSLIGSAYPDF